MRSVLVIDDNPLVGTALRLLFGLHDIRTLTASTPEEGLSQLAKERVQLVIADMNFSADTTSGAEGVALFEAIRARYPDLPIILLTAWTHLESAVRLVKAGAADYIAKPWDNDKLLAMVENLLELAETAQERDRLQREQQQRRNELARSYNLGDLVFRSQSMVSVVDLACRVARAPVPVLITGPNGAGKDRIAAMLHANSSVREGPFIAINCGALPHELIEAELFGAEAGAYTGANRGRIGRFELADGGTLFLDEIGNLPLTGQAKLLRVLETGEYEPLGSSRGRLSRARIVSATNSDLPEMIRAGRFREDLYYRLNVIEIALPALADRREDILPLVEHFLGGKLELAEDARCALLEHHWPGNVRELRNTIERAKLLCVDRVVRATDLSLPPRRVPSNNPAPVARNPDLLTREVIESALRQAAGNISRAAQGLGLSRQALYRRMDRLGLRP